MKIKVFAIYAMLFTICAVLSSCDDDSRTGVHGYSDCIICQGKGYCEKSEMFGLKTSYWDCIVCKSRSHQYMQGGNGPSFRGGVRGSCNIQAHGCSGYVSDGNHNCVNCAENGFDCHSVNHQYK